MCKASVIAEKTEDGKKGGTYGIATTAGGLGAFHNPGQAVAKCVVCIQNGVALVLSNIPAALQKTYGITATEQVKFVFTRHHSHDVLKFENGSKANLNVFADVGVLSFVGTMVEWRKAQATAREPLVVKEGPAMVVSTGVLATRQEGNRAAAG